MAKPAKYTDPDIVYAKFQEYLAKCREGERIKHINKRGQVIDEQFSYCPSVKDFCLYLDFNTASALDSMANQLRPDGSKNEEMSVIVSRVKMEIEAIRDRYAELGIIEPQIARMDYAKRNNLTDSKHTIEVDIGKKLRETLEKTARQAGSTIKTVN